MVPRHPIPRARQRSTRVDNCWHHPLGEWKRLIEYKSSFENRNSVDNTLLDSTPIVDCILSTATSERHERHDMPPGLEGQCACLNLHGL